MKKVIYLYMITVLVCLSFAGGYTYIENCCTDEIFDQKTSIEKHLYLKYCADPLSLNPFDSYKSKLENYLIYMCWIIGTWNLMDVLILLGAMNIPSSKPEDCLMWNVLNSKTYKVIVRKLKMRKSHGKENRKR